MASPTTTMLRRPWLRLRGEGGLAFSLYRIAGYIFFLALWAFLSKNVLNEVTLPSPATVWDEMVEIVSNNELWPNVRYTMTTFLIVFAIAFPTGVVVGVLMGRSRYWDAFFRDFVLAGLTTPGLVFVFVGIMLFGIDKWGRILPVVIIVIPLVVVNVVEGVRAVPRDLFDMSRAYEVPAARRMRHVLLPGIAPYLFTAARYAVAVGLRGAALVEVFGGTAGLGFQLRRNFDRFSIPGTLAWALFIVLIVVLVERLILNRLERYFFRWRPQAFA